MVNLTVESLLLELSKQQIKLSVVDGKLSVKGKLSGLNSDIKDAIKAHKEALITEIQKRSKSALVPMPRQYGEGVKASFAQQRLFFLDDVQGGSPEYNMQQILNVAGKIDLDAAQAALSKVIERHEILRTTYRYEKDVIKQFITDFKDVSFQIRVLDFTNQHTDEVTQLIANAVTDDFHLPFDLQKDLMLRVTFIKQSDEQGVLILNMHHIVSDGWSMEVLQKEFFELYQASASGSELNMPALPIQYADFSHWQHQNQHAFNEQLEYWKRQLDEAPAIHSVPLDKKRPTEKCGKGGRVAAAIDATLAKQLMSIAKAHQITPFVLLHALFSLLISRHSNQHDVVIGTPVANRLQAELEPLIGFFVNNVVTRVSTNHHCMSDFLAHVKQVHQQAQANQDVPFEQVVERLNVARNLQHTPLFQIMFTTSNDYGVSGSTKAGIALSDGVNITPVQPQEVQAKFDLELDVHLSEDGGVLTWTYDVSLFDAERIERMSRHFSNLLTNLC
ncbi:condensation domain-containing protein, partial [Pseudoalteromonas luteoviolacea]